MTHPSGREHAVRVREDAEDAVLVGGAVAIVVHLVAAFGGAGKDVRGEVVAVGGVLHMVLWRVAGRYARLRVPEAVAIGVGVPGGQRTLVDLPVAVLVHPVAALRRIRAHGGVGVVAVTLRGREAVGVGVGRQVGGGRGVCDGDLGIPRAGDESKESERTHGRDSVRGFSRLLNFVDG